jgi:peroxiredoxin
MQFIFLRKNITMFRLIILLISIWLFYTCSEPGPSGPTTINGKFTHFTGRWIFLEELEIKSIRKIDSIKSNDQGQFRFDPQITEPGFYILRTDKENFILLQLDKNEIVTVNADDTLFSNGYRVEGSDGSELLSGYLHFLQFQKQRIDSLAGVYYSSMGSENFPGIKARIDSVYETIFSGQKVYSERFIGDHAGLLASLIVLNGTLGNASIFDEEKDFILFHKTDSALMINYPGNKHAEDHHKRVNEIRTRIFDRYNAEQKLLPGKKAPNIVAQDTSGNMISLKQLEGRTVIVYFWAGWNAKSRGDNRKLIGLYPELKKKGIQILGVSLDDNERVWKGAMKLDRLPWMQISDLKGADSEAKKDYNLPDELPFYYLVDKDRRIIARDKDLENIMKKLQELL